MEKIAIFDTSSGGTPPTPIETASISVIYGQFATDVRRVNYSEPNNGGFCNLCGGGNNAVGQANDDSIKGNVFPANFRIESDFFISWGDVNGTAPEMAINIYENGILVENWLITSAQLTPNMSNHLAFSSLTGFSSNSAYSIRFALSEVGSSVEITGWSVAVSFNGF